MGRMEQNIPRSTKVERTKRGLNRGKPAAERHACRAERARFGEARNGHRLRP